MAKNDNDETKGLPKVDAPAPLTNEELMKMLIAQQAETAAANRALGEALLESRKPYVDPQVLKQKELALAERRQHIENQVRSNAATKRNCPHVRENGTPNIKWMQHSNGIVLGVCGQCRSEFDARVPADRELLRKDLKSIRNMGRAGEHAKRSEIAYA